MKIGRADLLRASMAVAIGAVAGWPRIAIATSAPTALQAQLVGRLASFDRNFGARAGGSAKVLLCHKAQDSESAALTSAVAKATAGLPDVGGLRPEVLVAELGDGARLAARCRSERIAIVYFGPATEPAMPAIAAALAGVDLLTIGASGLHAERGAVVGIDVEEGRPRLVVNLRSAKAQNVLLRAEVVKLARVVG